MGGGNTIGKKAEMGGKKPQSQLKKWKFPFPTKMQNERETKIIGRENWRRILGSIQRTAISRGKIQKKTGQQDFHRKETGRRELNGMYNENFY